MSKTTATIWLRVEDTHKFLTVEKIIKEDGSGILGMTIEGRDFLKSRWFNYSQVKQSTSDYVQINIPLPLFLAIKSFF